MPKARKRLRDSFNQEHQIVNGFDGVVVLFHLCEGRLIFFVECVDFPCLGQKAKGGSRSVLDADDVVFHGVVLRSGRRQR
jgi:hypothetical protein